MVLAAVQIRFQSAGRARKNASWPALRGWDGRLEQLDHQMVGILVLVEQLALVRHRLTLVEHQLGCPVVLTAYREPVRHNEAGGLRRRTGN
jgi:hypothetical protein